MITRHINSALTIIAMWAFAFTTGLGCQTEGGPKAEPASKSTPKKENLETDDESVACEVVERGLVICPDAKTLAAWAKETHVPEPDESKLSAPLDPPDPVEIRDGLLWRFGRTRQR